MENNTEQKLKSFMLRAEPELHEALRLKAKAKRMSLTQYCLLILQESLNQ